ncbi:MAG: TadE/TadG family type IV pilus assembly protein [Pirellulales bacterium]
MLSFQKSNLQLHNPRSRAASSRAGATIVEMAIITPIYFLLVFGIFEYARMGMLKQALTDASHIGSRKAALSRTLSSTDAEDVIRDHLDVVMSNSWDTDTCRVSFSPDSLSDVESGTEITTTIEVNMSDVSWIPPHFLGDAALRVQSAVKRE